MAFQSMANLAMVPLQDVLGMGSEHRMNKPGTGEGNWNWRFKKDDILKLAVDKLAHLTYIYGRKHD